ncbi:MAG: hypothetical protein R3B72_35690 [Polyangiaceae bacterium]
MNRCGLVIAANLVALSSGCDVLFGVDFDDALPASGGGGAVGTGGAGGGPGTGLGWTRLMLLEEDEVPHATTDFVRAIWCASLDRCVVATEGDHFEPGNLYAANHLEVTALLVDGDTVASDLAFSNLVPLGDGLAALVNRAEPLVMASEAFTDPTAWTLTELGDLDSLEGALNAQLWIGAGPDGSQLGLNNVVMTAPLPPGAGTLWSASWAPPTVPWNYFDLLQADPMICRGGPEATSRSPFGWVSADLGQSIYPVGNGFGEERPGACVSLDGGGSYRLAPLPEGEVNVGGPHGLRCIDAGHCWMFGNGSVTEPAYVYHSTGTLEAGLTWHRGKIPDGPERKLRNIAFAPDGVHGWLVGEEAPGRGLLLASDDGGATWSENLVIDVADFDGVALLSVFALDEANVWVGGDQGLIMSNGRAGRP